MNALAIALQGVGFQPLVLGLQGFAPVEQSAVGGGVVAKFIKRRAVRKPVEDDEALLLLIL